MTTTNEILDAIRSLPIEDLRSIQHHVGAELPPETWRTIAEAA